MVTTSLCVHMWTCVRQECWPLVSCATDVQDTHSGPVPNAGPAVTFRKSIPREYTGSVLGQYPSGAFSEYRQLEKQ